MGIGTPPKTERNQALIKDYQARNPDGTVVFEMIELEEKYDLSSTRIYKILVANNIPLDRPRDNISKFNRRKSKIES